MEVSGSLMCQCRTLFNCMKVKFLDLTTQTQKIKQQFLKEAGEFLDGGNFILTEKVEIFEKQFASLIGSAYAVGVSSGADALYLALAALNIGAGDEVITQGTAYNASVTAILRTGATPRFVDINPDTLTIDTKKIEDLITSRTKAILPVHLYGQAADMDVIMSLARKHNLFVVEDVAQAHLSTWSGKNAGSYGDIGCFSFYPTKNLGAFGDAGAVVTNKKELAEKLKMLRNLGQAEKNNHLYLGFNHRLDVLQAIALSLKIPFLKEETDKRMTAGRYYNQLLSSDKDFKPVMVNEKATHVYHLYVVESLSHNRDEVRAYLAKNGIDTAIHYPVPVYKQPFYKGEADSCPQTEKTLSRIFSLPMHSEITQKEQEYVINTLKKYGKE